MPIQPTWLYGPINLTMHLSGILGTDATQSQVARKLSLQKHLHAARFHRLIEPPDLFNIPDGYANAIVKFDQAGQIELLEIAVRFTEHNSDWTKFDDYLVANASPGLMKQICHIAFMANAEPIAVQFDVHADVDYIGNSGLVTLR